LRGRSRNPISRRSGIPRPSPTPIAVPGGEDEDFGDCSGAGFVVADVVADVVVVELDTVEDEVVGSDVDSEVGAVVVETELVLALMLK
jgi:hypothetical protein